MYHYTDLPQLQADGVGNSQEAWGRESSWRLFVNVARRVVRGGRASLMLPGPASADMRVVAASGVPYEAVATVAVRLGEAIAGLVAQTREPLLVNGGGSFARLVRYPTARYRTTAFISVPVPLQDGRCGVLNVADPIGRDAFREDDLEALQSLIALAGREIAPGAASARTQALERTIAELHKELVWVQEAERTRLARELHDEAGHALTLAVFRIDLERVKPGTTPEAREVLAHTREILLGCANSLHDIAFRLRPRILEDLGLIPALRALVAQLHDLAGLTVSLQVAGAEQPLSKEVELTAFRVIQEALTNTRRHADATAVSVRLAYLARGLRILVEDDGIGVDGDEVLAGGNTGLGLLGMRERVAVLGGELVIARRPSGGTRLEVALPLRQREGAHVRA